MVFRAGIRYCVCRRGLAVRPEDSGGRGSASCFFSLAGIWVGRRRHSSEDHTEQHFKCAYPVSGKSPISLTASLVGERRTAAPGKDELLQRD